MNDLPPAWVLVLLIAAEVAFGLLCVGAVGFAYGWFGAGS